MTAEAAAKERLGGIAALVKLAWDIALIFPEFGDEIIADLTADIQGIIDREAPILAADAREESRGYWEGKLLDSLCKRNEMAAGIASVAVADGFEPIGWYVYLLWPSRDAEVPVYVGQSGNVCRRLGEHMELSGKRWVANWVTLLRCESEAAMKRTEAQLIAHYQPRLNLQGRSR